MGNNSMQLYTHGHRSQLQKYMNKFSLKYLEGVASEQKTVTQVHFRRNLEPAFGNMSNDKIITI